jgi:hypothetical protein
MSLYKHGIEEDESTYRIHVGFQAKAIYVFLTENGRKAADVSRQEKLAGQPGVNYKTAKGKAVPWQKIEGCAEIPIPLDILSQVDCHQYNSTSIKGQKAVQVVKEMFLRGLIPLSFCVSEVTEQDLQVRGLDIVVESSVTIQIKCDYRCGSRHLGGTGNIFLQTHECNPLNMY